MWKNRNHDRKPLNFPMLLFWYSVPSLKILSIFLLHFILIKCRFDKNNNFSYYSFFLFFMKNKFFHFYVTFIFYLVPSWNWYTFNYFGFVYYYLYVFLLFCSFCKNCVFKVILYRIFPLWYIKYNITAKS